jgi:hypothetical protein
MPKHQTTGKHKEFDGKLPHCDDGHFTVSKGCDIPNDIMALTAVNCYCFMPF